MTLNVTDTGVGTVRAGFIGAGFMAAVHSRASRAALAQPVALATSTPQRAVEASAALGIERASRSAAELIGDPDIDVVHICTPNATHAEYASAAIEADKHVICEKPLATSVEDASALARAARQQGVVAAVPFVYRYHPIVREARARVERGDLGRLLTLNCSYLQDWLQSVDDVDWRVDPAIGGPSRAFADIGSHLCDLLEFVTGDRIARLSARTTTVHPHRRDQVVETEDVAALLVEMESGAIGTALVSQVAPGRKNSLVLEIAGADESMRFDQEQPESLWIGSREGGRVIMRDPATASPDSARLSSVPAGHPMGYQDAFNAFAADVYAAIGGAHPEGLPTFDDGLRTVQITDAVLRSAASGEWAEV